MSDLEKESRRLRELQRQDFKKMDKGKTVAEIRKEVVEEALVTSDRNNSSEEESVDEEKLEEIEKRVREMKVVEEKLIKKDRYRRLSKEASDLEKAIKQKKKEKNDKSVDSASLRGMSEVMEKVDKLMDEKINFMRQESSSSSDSASSAEESSRESSGEREQSRKNKHKHGKRGKSSRKSRKSGKNKKITSTVKYPQLWPHSQLSLHFVNKDKKFEELSIAEFCAGYATILELEGQKNMGGRVSHFKELMYLATRYQWKNVLNYHAACLLEIERGHKKWDDSFQMLQNTTLAGGFLNQSSFSSGGFNNSGGGSRNFNGGRVGDGPVLFCKSYQRGVCTSNQDHMGLLGGENRFLRHICAKCWLKERKRAAHPENSVDCPSREEEL